MTYTFSQPHLHPSFIHVATQISGEEVSSLLALNNCTIPSLIIMSPKKKTSDNSGDGDDWLASLARQSTASDAAQQSSKRKGNTNKGAQQSKTSSSPSQATTKAERVQRREQKKLQREERKRAAEEARNAKKLLLQQRKRKRNDRGGSSATEEIITKSSASSSITDRDAPPRKRKGNRRGMNELSKRALLSLSLTVKSSVSQHDNYTASTHHQHHQKHKKNKASNQDSNPTKTLDIINGLPADPKGKATKSSTLRPDSKELQPRRRDYNGQGLVRPSLFLPLNDPSFVPKLEFEFAEHIDGFYGKAKTKSAKKQSDENMLWRRCLKAKEVEGDSSGSSRKKKKKKRGVGGEDRVDSMIRQGVM